MELTDWREVDEPKIWVSRFMTYLDPVLFRWRAFSGDNMKYINAAKRDWALVAQEDAPEKAFFDEHRKIPDKVRDAFLLGGSLAISRELRDVLLQFDIGQTQLFEVPICADENGTPSGLPNCFMMNVHAPKDTFIIEHSKWIGLPISPFRKEPSPGAKYRPQSSSEILAVKASAAQGADLWHDPEFHDRFFLSDRLKQAIDAANLKTTALDLYPARVFERA